MGITSAVLWQRFHRTKLPLALASSAAVGSSRSSWPSSESSWAVVFGLVWQPIGEVDNFDTWMNDIGAVGAGLFGLVNRVLIPIGMHQFVNIVSWFQIGDFPPPTAGAR